MLKSQHTSKSPAAGKSPAAIGRQRSYNEIIEFLDANWATNAQDTALSCIKTLDKELGSVAKNLTTVFISGTNGKSTTAHFTTRLLQEENLTVGTLQAPHLLSYTERLLINNEPVSTKLFADLANTVLNTAEQLKLTPGTLDTLVMMSLLHFKALNVDIALLEVGTEGAFHPANVCTPKIVAVTRVVEDTDVPTNKADIKRIEAMLATVKAGMHVVSADQGKLNLQSMQSVVEDRGATWVMPIRKLAPLEYPFEQLHGRCAALAERIARIYANELAPQNTIVEASSLLAHKKGQRGRPTLEAKRQSELNPRRTVEQFWKETVSTLPGRFQLLDKEKPTTLLDNASNLDAFENLLLGVRLLHYQRPLKGMALIIGASSSSLDKPEFLKLLRYFFKKTSGRAILCPVDTAPGNTQEATWDIEKVANDIKNLKIKAHATPSLQDALELAHKGIDERNGLIVITGSNEIISEYWTLKGIKKV